MQRVNHKCKYESGCCDQSQKPPANCDQLVKVEANDNNFDPGKFFLSYI